jgi:hypothetical protein
MNRDALLEDVKGLLRRSIASTLKIEKAEYDASLDTQTAVKRCLSMVMAIGYNETLDGALDDLCEMGSLFNTGTISREIVQKEVMACLNTFRFEIWIFKRMHEMNQNNMEPQEIWNDLVSKIREPAAEPTPSVQELMRNCEPDDEASFMKRAFEFMNSKNKKPKV